MSRHAQVCRQGEDRAEVHNGRRHEGLHARRRYSMRVGRQRDDNESQAREATRRTAGDHVEIIPAGEK